MSAKALLKTYIKQGKEYRKMLQKVNDTGKYSAKIKKIDQKIRNAEKTLKGMH